MLYKTLSHNTTVKISGISRTQQNTPQSANLLMVSGDITDSNIRKNFIQKTIQQFHNIDVLINNAGIVKEKKFIEYTDLDFIE
ncbi:MAG TPA: SDR family NAD(P)-dependent oxidoreductase, partial [Candidatus Lokiarchaeia archaeon]